MRNIVVLAGLLAFQMTLSAQTRHLAAVSEVENEARIVTPDLDVYVERALKVFDSPGLALAIVKDGKTVFAKGYGMRRRGDPARVDENTLFQIGSTTKAFTAAALATLVDQGNFDWDKPVRTYLPWFEMYDPYVSKEITTRDLLSHRSGLGLGEGDLLMFPESDYSRHELIRRMRFLPPTSSFRSHWAYCNLCVLAASEIIPEITGLSWEEYVHSRLLTPVGMKSTRTSLVGLSPTDNVASAHELVNGVVAPISWQRMLHWTNVETIAPIGSAVSNVVDMSKWISVNLAHGKLPGTNTQVFSESQSSEMWASASSIPIEPEAPGLETAQKHFFQSGLGWFTWDYRGTRVVEHSGGAPGNTTEIVLLPEQNCGFVIFVNSPSDFPNEIDAVERKIMDMILAAPETDWISKYLSVRNSRREKEKADVAAASRRNSTSKPSLPLEQYVGIYADPWFGEVEIAYVDGGLVFRAPHQPSLTGSLEHSQHDCFVVHWKDAFVPDAYLYFSLGPDSKVTQFKMAAVSSRADFSFDFQDLVFHPKLP